MKRGRGSSHDKTFQKHEGWSTNSFYLGSKLFKPFGLKHDKTFQKHEGWLTNSSYLGSKLFQRSVLFSQSIKNIYLPLSTQILRFIHFRVWSSNLLSFVAARLKHAIYFYRHGLFKVLGT